MLIPLGQVVVPTGGTPVAVTNNLGAGVQPPRLQSITIQVRPANTGLLYVRIGGVGDDRTTRRYTLAILPVPVSATQGPFASVTFSLPATPTGINPGNIYLDVSVNGDGGIITGTQG